MHEAWIHGWKQQASKQVLNHIHRLLKEVINIIYTQLPTMVILTRIRYVQATLIAAPTMLNVRARPCHLGE